MAPVRSAEPLQVRQRTGPMMLPLTIWEFQILFREPVVRSGGPEPPERVAGAASSAWYAAQGSHLVCQFSDFVGGQGLGGELQQ